MRRSLILLALLAACAPGPNVAEHYDLLIANGTVIDGTGAARYKADVAVTEGRIVRISRRALSANQASRVIDATGQIVAPGFIDMHAHLDPLLGAPLAESHVRQGVTTALGGPDGGSPFPIGRYLDTAQSLGLGLNLAMLVGHNTIRATVMGSGDRAPTPAELDRMRAMVAQAMGDGAFGMSTGLEYVPGAFAHTDEIVALAREAADSGGIYTSHMRDEGRGLMASVDETIAIGRGARIPVVITHAKVIGRPRWGTSGRMLEAVDAARREGIDAMLDVYPYTASSTGLSVLIPSWALAGGSAEFARRARDRRLRDSLVAGIVDLISNERGGDDLTFAQFARVAWDHSLEGRTMADWAVQRGMTPSAATGAALVIDAQLRGGASMVYHVMDETDVRRILSHPMTMIGSDGRLSRPGEGMPHPRAYGTFPRVLARYVREQGVLTLEQAIHKMTGMPATRLGLTGRGTLAPGAFADVVVFDPATVADRSTFADPHQYPVGINWVVVGGVVTVDTAGMTGQRGGVALRRPAR